MRGVSKTIQIRRVRRQDAPLLADVAESMFREAFASQNDPAQIELYCRKHFNAAAQDAELADPNVVALLMTGRSLGDEAVIGYAQLGFGLRPSVDIEMNGESVELQRFYVARDHHGRGVAQTLMDNCLACATERNADVMFLGVWKENPRAIAFYRRTGFDIVGEQVFMLGTEQQYDYVMARKVQS